MSNFSIKVADTRIRGGVDDSYAYHITGQPGKNKYLRFTTNLGGSKNGYVLSGWVKSNTTPVRGSRAFKAMAYCDGENAVYQAEANISTYSEGWKYFCLLLPAGKWESTQFSICFYDNIGELTIDGLQLTRNDVQTKSYDSRGRVTSSYRALKSDDYTYVSWGNITRITDKASKNCTYRYKNNSNCGKWRCELSNEKMDWNICNSNFCHNIFRSEFMQGGGQL